MQKNIGKIYFFLIIFYCFFNYLTAQPQSDEEFSYTEKIFYVFEDSRGLFQIASMDLDGNNKLILTKEGNNCCPSISPKGDLIAFFSDRTGTVNLWIMEPDGKNQKQLTFEENPTNKIDLYNRGKIGWLKDSDYILFILNDDIWQIDLEGNNPFVLTSTHDITMFKLSPDKSKILFSKEKTKNHNGLWVMLIDGKNPIQIEKSLIPYPSFDWVTNDRIIFLNNSGIIFSLFNGTDRKIITQIFYPFNDLTWGSPNNTNGFLSFISNEKDGPNIWIIDNNGGNAKQITKKTGRSPVWYKDGKTLFYVEEYDIYKLNLTTSEKKQLTYHFQTYFPVIAEIKLKKQNKKSGEPNEKD